MTDANKLTAENIEQAHADAISAAVITAVDDMKRVLVGITREDWARMHRMVRLGRAALEPALTEGVTGVDELQLSVIPAIPVTYLEPGEKGGPVRCVVKRVAVHAGGVEVMRRNSLDTGWYRFPIALVTHFEQAL